MASPNKIIAVEINKDMLIGKVSPKDIGFKPAQVWNPSPSNHHRVTAYDLPKDITTGLRGTEESGAKYSPAPFAVIVENGDKKALVNVVAKAGWHRFNRVTLKTTKSGVRVEIDLEGHTRPKAAAPNITIQVINGNEGETRHELLARGLAIGYPKASKPRDIPDWWLKPSYCGWGDQVTIAQFLEGVGEEKRALSYCTQGLYNRWVKRLEDADVPIGTITIDAGWSPTGVWEPNPIFWPDMRQFVDEQHAKGRKVVLWIGTWLPDGIDPKYCTTCDGETMTTDPTNPAYLKLVTKWVKHLIGPDGINADGFKIDQLSHSPTHHDTRYGPRFGWLKKLPNTKKRRKISFHGDGFGTELLYKLQKTIYKAAKSVKPDCLITSSTVHPYFHDTLDMVRIHDMGPVAKDIFEAMKARVDLGKAALPYAAIDTDDWIHTNYETWLKYTAGSHILGVPCIFYAEYFMLNWREEPATKLIPMGDLKKIAREWKKNAP